MSMDNTPRSGIDTGQTTDSIADTEASMFGAPIWERRGKKRGFGKSAAPLAREPRTFDNDPLDAPLVTAGVAAAGPNPLDAPISRPQFDTQSRIDPLDAPLVGGTSVAADIAAGDARPHHLHDVRMHEREMHEREHEPMAAPIGRERTVAKAKKSGPPAAAMALGVLALGGLGLAGVYALQGDDSVPELTPGVESPTAAAPPMTDGAAVATAPAPPAATETARAAPAPAVTERRTTRTAAASRTRPASAPSASDAAISASGTAALPAGPQPYSSVNPDAPAVTPPPTQSTAPATVDPAPIPETPPVSPDPAPATVAPESPAETPPQ